MAPNLCAHCRRLPSTLFQADYDEQGVTGGPEIYLPPLYILRQNADEGCMLCKIWTTKPNVDGRPERLLPFKRIRLRRSVIAPHMSITAYIDMDDIFVVYFSRIPPVWGETSTRDTLSRHNTDPNLTDVPPNRSNSVQGFENHLNRTWLDICRSQHPACNKGLGCTKEGPSRLLDLQAFEVSGDIKLVDCRKWDNAGQMSIFPRFVCLSNCWGEPSARPKMTTRASLSQHLERISLSELSQTFKDAIRISRQLEERYLWIDSLCIVQDDPRDWEIEAARMPAIYGSATLTIAALDAENGNGGCSVDPEPAAFVDVDTASLRLRFFQQPPPHWHKMHGDDRYQHDGYGTKPLRTRAWTLQERLLSPRTVHYANGIMLWECNTTKGSSIVPWGHHDPPDDFVPWPVLDSTHESSATNEPMASRAQWFGILEDYSNRFMTKETDKLPALSGVAAKLASMFQGDKYHAGLFQRHLPAALLWRSLGTRHNYNMNELSDTVRKYSAFWPRRPMHYRAPSWSWAGLDGATSYDSQRLTNNGGPRPETGAPLRENVLQVLDVQTCQRSSDPFGAVESSHLRVLGRTAVVQLHWNTGINDYGLDDEPKLLTTFEGEVAGLLYPDIVNELQFVQNLVCLEVRDEPFWTETTIPHTLYGVTYDTAEKWKQKDLVLALALVPVPGDVGLYQRTGLVRWMRRDVFRHAEQIELTLV